MFKEFYVPDMLRPVFGELVPKSTPFRGASVVQDHTSAETQILICGTDPGALGVGAPWSHAAELALVRAELPEFGVEEVFSAELGPAGYLLLVQPICPPEKTNAIGDVDQDCWTFTAEGELALGRLLKGLGDLAWRAWEQVEASRIARELEEDEAEGEAGEEEGEAASS
jgi:hypothetical protein